MKHHIKPLIFMLCLCTFNVYGTPAPIKIDPTSPIQIQADTASFDQTKQEAVHTGNVILTQGTHVLHADTLTLKKDLKGQLNVITAIGNPATFDGKRQNDPNPVYATAKTIYYYPDKQLIVLEGSATIEHQQDKFRGPVLSYQLDKQIINATKQSDERPIITIHPRA
ncbi:lipopolysaccharide transport periplasmic protein LptA [Candidatus Berkiella aquae]|uniref:Lipopolysaccharide export system protein LptA n=1 Tax=Candidatus Berkiella aquae TaxID=295108 RepID=A0A0Q9YLJ4_9GAMM|nr:lipopolysaccharide transport periplasmic protein LptA [Candidatus Berkiella aquae]MCS5710730.1 lipopolysaccharide transport periplasmic protein LptA [Candidatus Berkiella aquae]